MPRSGPLRGGTLVTVAGLNLANGSHSHRCRFGDAGWAPGTLAELGTPADPDGPRGAARTTLRCVAPLASALAEGAVNLSLSLERDNQTLHTYAAHTLPFELYNDSVFAAVLCEHTGAPDVGVADGRGGNAATRVFTPSLISVRTASNAA